MDDGAVARRAPVVPGEVSAGMKTALAGAVVLTVMMATLLVVVVDREVGGGASDSYAGLLAGGGLFVWSALVDVALATVRGVSWWARTAVALAMVHLGMMLVIAVAWHAFHDPYVELPLVHTAPVHWISLALGGALIGAALLGVGRRGVPGWLQGAAIFAAVYLLALGAWIPMVIGALDPASILDAAAVARQVLPVVLAVPLVVAALATRWVLVARRDADGSARRRGALGVPVLAIAYTAALAAAPRDNTGRMVLSNLGHVLVGAVALAWCALIALAIGHLRALRAVRHDRRRPAPWVQEGVVVDDAGDEDDGVVARLGFVGWLGGFAAAARGFRLRTRDAELPVPAGARVLAHLGAWSVAAAPGHSRPVVRAGDRVQVSGFVAPPAAGPFRGGVAPVAGSSGLVLGIAGEASPAAGSELVLALWRPCLLFLGASVLAALPVLVGS